MAVVVTLPRVWETLSASFSNSSVSGYKPEKLSDEQRSNGVVCTGGGDSGREIRDELKLLNSTEKYEVLNGP